MGDRPDGARSTWNENLYSEVGFWTRWFASKGLEWPDDYRTRLDPDTELQPIVARYLAEMPGPNYSILDVGAGPLTWLGKRWRDQRVRITATDPLADFYDRIMEDHQVVPLVRTTWCHGELLQDRFPPASFDLVWARNSLDHSYDPCSIIERALGLVKVGGYELLLHAKNEGENEKYEGLHQWNFCDEKGSFVIWNKHGRVDMSRRLADRARTRCIDEGSSLMLVEIQRLK